MRGRDYHHVPLSMTLPAHCILPDGRRLTFATYGATDRARWIIYLHGFPGSRKEGSLWDAAARARGFTLVAPDRPGFGSTEPKDDRTLLAWASDVEALCSHLSIERAALIGVSGGGPYALACAHALPHRISSLHLVSSLAPPDAPGVFAGMASGNRLMFTLMRESPLLAERAIALMASLWAHSPRLCLAWFRFFVPSADRQILNRPEIRNLMLENVRIGFERGPKGPAEDFPRIAKPWGFSVAEVAIPTTVWHGLADTYVPAAMGEYLAKTIPGADYRTFPTSGHLLVLERLEEILDTVGSLEERAIRSRSAEDAPPIDLTPEGSSN